VNIGLAVALGVWNSLLLGALVGAIVWRKRVFSWITEADCSTGGDTRSADARWQAFLAAHPELREQR
jgi:hypothetical protein